MTRRFHAVAVALAYSILGVLLGWSRLAGLGGGYCCDEIGTVVGYVRTGPDTILAGDYLPNNHQLFSLMGWATSSLIGESETALRLLAAMPFLAGVIVFTAWLHRRAGALSGILFLFLATVSPLLLDITRLARGYGLAFLAMSVLIMAAFEARKSAGSGWLVAFLVAGIVGGWTLPHFTIAFVSVGAVLVAYEPLRTRCAIGLGISSAAIAAWYAPHLDDILDSSRQDYGAPIETAWILSAPIDQTLIPALTLLDDQLLRPNLASLLFAVTLGIVIAYSPLLRRRDSALILTSGVVTTIGAFWLTGTNVAPRFFSYLLVPLFALVATGAASALSRYKTLPTGLVAALVAAVLTVIGIRAAPFLEEIPRTPRESLREAAATIHEVAPSAPVLANVPHPHDLEFHLGRPVTKPESSRDVVLACTRDRAITFVVQPWLVTPMTIPCVDRPGTRHYRFEQYARGDAVEVWIVPSPS